MHRRLLPGDYTEYLKVQRIHRKRLPHPSEGRGDKFASILQKLSEKKSQESLSSYVRIGTPPLSGRSGGALSTHLPRWNRAFLKIIASERGGNYPWWGLYNLTLTPSVRVQNCVKNTYQNIHIIKAITKHAPFFMRFCNILLIEISDSLPLKNKYIRFQNYNPPSQNLILFSTQTSSFLC